MAVKDVDEYITGLEGWKADVVTSVRHVKLTGLDDIDEEAFADFIDQAVSLNRIKGDPIKGG